MIAFKDSLNKRLKDKNFRREYDDIRPEMDIIRATVKTRKEKLIFRFQTYILFLTRLTLTLYSPSFDHDSF